MSRPSQHGQVSAMQRRKKCVAKGCETTSGSGHSMHQFPKDPVLREMWADAVCDTGYVPKDSSLVCSLHFLPECYTRLHDESSEELPHQRRKLKADAVPMNRSSMLLHEEHVAKRARQEVRNLLHIIVACI